MNVAVTWYAAESIAGSRARNMPQPIVVASHLCASMVAESACSMAATRCRSRSDAMTAPPQAASTWYQRPWRWASSAQASRGSIIPALVVPAAPTISTGTQPRARSSSMAPARAATDMRPVPSVGMSLAPARPMPVWWAILTQPR